MRIHTDLSMFRMTQLLKADERLRDVSYIELTEHRSQTHSWAYDVHLTGNYSHSSVNGAARKRTNSGTHGAGYYFAATFDEWGYFFGALYDADPTARSGGTRTRPVYADREDFHDRTHGVYRPIGAELAYNPDGPYAKRSN